MNILYIVIIIILTILAIIAFIIGKKSGEKSGRTKILEEAKQKEEHILNKSKNLEENLKNRERAILQNANLKAKEIIIAKREEFEKELNIKRKEMDNKEKRLIQMEENLGRKEDKISKKEDLFEYKKRDLLDKERKIKIIEENLKVKEKELQEAEQSEIENLEKISQYSAEDAKNQLIEIMEKEAQYEFSFKLKKFEEDFETKKDLKARDILVSAIEKISVDFVNESTISTIALPNDEMKGRLIGREGRNIRTFESVSGVDLIIDDTPDVITVSSFNPIRREKGSRLLAKLISDGRIHPKRIEDLYKKIDREVDVDIKKTGEEVAYEFGFTDLNPNIILLLGKLKFRTSYGQNALQHSKEVAYIAEYLARDLGLDVEIAKRGGLLHDIGKAIDREVEGNHQELGAEIAKKYGEDPRVVNAIRAHHGDVPYTCLEAATVKIGDAVSASRPGARRESYHFFIKRVKMLEAIASSFFGIEKAFAIQAGRELRIIANYKEINDDEARMLVRNIAKKVSDEVKFPGTINIMLIRETRVEAEAK